MSEVVINNRIAVITLHHVRNQGSLLQTYATQSFLNGAGYDCTVIDYIPVGLSLKKGIATIKKSGNPLKDAVRKCGAGIAFSLQQSMVRRFLRENVKLTERVYHTYKELADDPPVADVYISGSDQIWNTQNANDPDDIKGYYLRFAPAGRKRISYASSIGKDSFDGQEAKTVSKYLGDYGAISVREKQAVELLGSIGVKNAVHVVDPTLLLCAEEWKAFCKKNKGKKRKKPYIFVYNLNRNPHIKQMAVNLAKKENLDIVNFADTLDFIKGVDNALFNSPHDFLSYLASASYVLTDSFHGTAFSINMGKQFVVFPAPRFNSRIESLLELFDLSDRLWTPEMGVDFIPERIDYERVENRLEEERQRCRQWLIEAIEK